jgi:acetyl esterase/lipase
MTPKVVLYGEVLGYRPLELDLYLPPAEGPHPVIVHVHGGGWRRGSRREPLPGLSTEFYENLAEQGFAVAAVDYRLSGGARFPAALDDVRAAVDWVRDTAVAYGLDAGRVFLWGDSAGAHLALLAALTGSALTGAKVQRLVAWFPVTDLAGLVPGASHFWKGADDVPAIIRRSIGFLRARA